MTTLAFALAATVKHDGQGGVADLLSTPTEAVAWLTEHQDSVTEVLGRPLPLLVDPPQPRAASRVSGKNSALGDGFFPESGVAGAGVEPVGEVVRRELLGVRRAVRTMFARAVAAEAPSKADADRLMYLRDVLWVV